MKVSIITVTYNCVNFIESCILSIKNQSYKNIEHIIVDGGSNDGTVEIIKKHEKNISRWISEKDNGLYFALNKGIDFCSGEIIGILHADDFYAYPEVIEDVVNIFTNTASDAVYGDLKYVDSKNTKKITRVWKAGNYRLKSFEYGWMPPHPAFFVKRDIYLKYGKFNTTLQNSADYELMLRFLYKHQIKASYLPKTLVNMRIGGISNKNIRSRINANVEDRKAWKINGLKPKFYTLWLKPLRKIKQFLSK